MTEVIGVVGAGYVGATTAAGLAHLGYAVAVVDTDPVRAQGLARGESGLSEPDLDDLFIDAIAAGRLGVSCDYSTLDSATVVFVCVPTPMRSDGAADLTFIDSALDGLRPFLRRDDIVVLKSTVPVGTGDTVASEVGDLGVHVVANPEFLREGHTVEDFLHPDRVVVGGTDTDAMNRVADLYSSLNAPTVCLDRRSAELAKYACNSFLAMKLSFVDELAALSERMGADISCVTEVMGLDPRIGRDFLRPGPGWGGSCFPKDTRALASIADAAGRPMRTLTAAIDANEAQSERIVDEITSLLPHRGHDSTVALLGMTFKAGTADLRESPALKIAAALTKQGVRVVAHDPTVSDVETLGTRMPSDFSVETELVGDGDRSPTNLDIVSDPLAIAGHVDAIVVTTEWPAYGCIDWPAIARNCPETVVFDTRGIVDAAAVRTAGLRFKRVGVAEGP